jgi:hypothetical protein
MARNVYVVEGAGAPPRLIEASMAPQALAYAARSTFKVRLASQHDLIDLIGRGTALENRESSQQEMLEDEPEITVDPAGNVVVADVQH